MGLHGHTVLHAVGVLFVLSLYVSCIFNANLYVAHNLLFEIFHIINLFFHSYICFQWGLSPGSSHKYQNIKYCNILTNLHIYSCMLKSLSRLLMAHNKVELLYTRFRWYLENHDKKQKICSLSMQTWFFFKYFYHAVGWFYRYWIHGYEASDCTSVHITKPAPCLS